MNKLSQLQRLLIALLEIALLLAIQRIGFGSWFPSPGPSGLWLYAALLSVVLASRLITPFYEKPVDVIAYTVSALVAIWLSAQAARIDHTVNAALWIATLLLGLGLLASCLAVVTFRTTWTRTNVVSKLIGERLGSAPVAYSLVILFAVLAFHSNSPAAILWIAAAWALTIIFKPFEHIFFIAHKIWILLTSYENIPVFGTVRAYQSPGLVLIEEKSKTEAKSGQIFGFLDPYRGPQYAAFLDYVGREERRLVRAHELRDSTSDVWQNKVISRQLAHSALIIDKDRLTATNPISESVISGKSVAGIVAPDSTIERLYFEITNNADLEEGRLVETYINSKPVVYQIVGGMTREEVVYQKNTFGYARGQAQKIGRWDSDKKKFELVKWLPLPNTPVFLKDVTDTNLDPEAIGHFPYTEYTARIEDINSLVTHNTAILGILGIGKSMLSIELVERMLAEGIKVICLDLTDQYAKELSAFIDPKYELSCISSIREASEKDRDLWAENPQEGGSLPNLREAIFTDVKQFLRSDNPRLLKIYDPTQFLATKQTSEPKSFSTGEKDNNNRDVWGRRAALWQVTPVEVTQIVSETALLILQDRMSDKARVCLVYEEAHSLVPEWNSVVVEGDKTATNGTARAILQGRKYGLGCLLVTQRTANVTKTILNQCNTVFAMRTFDTTGIEFLSNYIGKDYASVLSSISERHAVLFGKASSCENPILLRLNDRQTFLEAFRKKYPPSSLPDWEQDEEQAEHGSSEGETTGDINDDIPF